MTSALVPSSTPPPNSKAKANPLKRKIEAPELSSPSKKRRLEEDGLVVMESVHDKLEDEDIIEID